MKSLQLSITQFSLKSKAQQKCTLKSHGQLCIWQENIPLLIKENALTCHSLPVTAKHHQAPVIYWACASFNDRLLRALPSAFAGLRSAEGYTQCNPAAASLEHKGTRICVIANEFPVCLLAAFPTGILKKKTFNLGGNWTFACIEHSATCGGDKSEISRIPSPPVLTCVLLSSVQV